MPVFVLPFVDAWGCRGYWVDYYHATLLVS